MKRIRRSDDGSVVRIATLTSRLHDSVWRLVGDPIVEFNPAGVVVRNAGRSFRIGWDDVLWFGDGTSTVNRNAVWVLAICSTAPISGIRQRDVPIEEQMRRKHGKLPRHMIACRATIDVRRRRAEIVDAVRAIASEHAIPAHFADQASTDPSSRRDERPSLWAIFQTRLPQVPE